MDVSVGSCVQDCTVILYHHFISSLIINLENFEVFTKMAVNDSHLLGGDLMYSC